MTKSHWYHWFLWWNVSERELNKQVTQYGNLRIWQSARGLSAIFVLITIPIMYFAIPFESFAARYLLEYVILVVLSVFILKGHRWAIFLCILFSTLLEIMEILLRVSDAIYYSHRVIVVTKYTRSMLSISLEIFVRNVVWWATSMHAFYMALRVENIRKRNLTNVGNV